MNVSPSSNDSCSHAFKGVARGAQAGASYIGMGLTILLVATAVLGLFAGDVFFVYRYASTNLTNLIWAIPVGLGFMALDVYFSFLIRNGSRVFMGALHEFAQHGRDRMNHHFSLISNAE